jgi:hypothetical protein
MTKKFFFALFLVQSASKTTNSPFHFDNKWKAAVKKSRIVKGRMLGKRRAQK